MKITQPTSLDNPISMITIIVDGTALDVPAGINLLQACLDNGIYIPHLCHCRDRQRPAASCRLCFVEIEGEDAPVAACTIPLKAPITVRTDTSAVRRLQRSALNMLLSVHDVACKTCPANRQCPLQDMARFLKVGLKAKNLPLRLKTPENDTTHPLITHWPNRCVLCGLCIHACRTANGRPLMTFAGRGFDTVVRFFVSDDLAPPDSQCEDCNACIRVCPVAALTPAQ